MWHTLFKGISGITGVSVTSLFFADVDSPLHVGVWVASTLIITTLTTWNLILDSIKKRRDLKEKEEKSKD